MRISGRNLADKKTACIKWLFKKIIINFNFNSGYPVSVGISTELGSEVLMNKTKQNKNR